VLLRRRLHSLLRFSCSLSFRRFFAPRCLLRSHTCPVSLLLSLGIVNLRSRFPSPIAVCRPLFFSFSFSSALAILLFFPPPLFLCRLFPHERPVSTSLRSFLFTYFDLVEDIIFYTASSDADSASGVAPRLPRKRQEIMRDYGKMAPNGSLVARRLLQ